jgi:hypothetical protein
MKNDSQTKTELIIKSLAEPCYTQAVEQPTLKQLLLSDTARTDFLTAPRVQPRRRKIVEIE